jgi:hypothetical protein
MSEYLHIDLGWLDFIHMFGRRPAVAFVMHI